MSDKLVVLDPTKPGSSSTQLSTFRGRSFNFWDRGFNFWDRGFNFWGRSFNFWDRGFFIFITVEISLSATHSNAFLRCARTLKSVRLGTGAVILKYKEMIS